jgi:hypothetical protein
MAQDKFTNTSSQTTDSFNKGLVKDLDENFHPEGSWFHARNAINNSVEGDIGIIGNEPANYLCARAPYQIIAGIHIYKTYWAIFSTDDINSEIGLFNEQTCTYQTIVNDPCLNFKKIKLISGVAKFNFDCSLSIYFADGLNPDKVLNIGLEEQWPKPGDYTGDNFYNNTELWPGVAWKERCLTENSCTTCTSLNQLDCEKLRLSSLMSSPCLTLSNGDVGGSLFNGSYIATIVYSINGQAYGSYMSPSNPVPVFSHSLQAGALVLELGNLDTTYFSEFQLVIVSTINGATSARTIGTYNTRTNKILIDYINPDLSSIPLDNIPIQNPIYEKSDEIYTLSDYLIRVAPTTRFDFNYQPIANQIDTKWVVSRYPARYYKRGGYVTGYLRDEVYAFWIRWVYSTGEKSSSYHIPGRYKGDYYIDPTQLDPIGSANVETYFDPGEGIAQVFETTNTATVTDVNYNVPTENGGQSLSRGYMGYWESSEIYPDNRPDIWNATNDPKISGSTDTKYDLCGKPIRHHKMPEDIIRKADGSYTIDYGRSTVGADGKTAEFINIVGVEFDNIKPPVYYDADGNIQVVPGIIGYEILRSTREGNRTIIAKGIINNMRSYNTPNAPASSDTDPSTFNGLYQNYPYNSLRTDPTLSLTEVNGEGGNYTQVNGSNVRKDYFTFHSPETQFYKPFLAPKELRLYSEQGTLNNVVGNFEDVPGHPQQKLLTDLALSGAALLGIAEAAKAMQGKMSRTVSGARVLDLGIVLGGATNGGTVPAGQEALITTLSGAATTAYNTSNSLDFLARIFTNLSAPVVTTDSSTFAAYVGYGTPGGILGPANEYYFERGDGSYLPVGLRNLAGLLTFSSYWNTATGNSLDLIEALIPFRKYVYRSLSHGLLHREGIGNISTSNFSNKRFGINDAAYIDNSFSYFADKNINNLYRPACAVLKTGQNVINPQLVDTSCTSIGDLEIWDNPTQTFTRTSSCYYAGLKIRVRNLYGQLESVKQVPIKCITRVNSGKPIPDTAITSTVNGTPLTVTLFNDIYKSPVLFGGDIYIGRYTEKNTFFYFYDWLYKEPDGTNISYQDRFLGLYPRYWANFEDYDSNGFIISVVANLFNPSEWNIPSNLNNLDRQPIVDTSGIFQALDIGDIVLELIDTVQAAVERISFGVKDAYMYLFQSSVRDIMVESEINVDLRDWDDIPEKRHYDPYEPYTSLPTIFDTSIIKFGNYYKYDRSLTSSNLWNNLISWGAMQDRQYNPTISSLCYQYQPFRLLYSLPNSTESKQDGWRVFLNNNYKDFGSTISNVKPIGKNGALILFDNDSPVQFQGVDTLETDLGTKITIGDGGLFSQPMQSVINTDIAYEYGSCQDRLSVINTPSGTYWMSQSLGKVFGIGQGLDEISAYGLKWWFAKFLPFRILVDFPDFDLIDNPVAGVGCLAMFDNQDQITYFSKRDYELRSDAPEPLIYNGSNQFIGKNSKNKVVLGDPLYFSNASWTVSYDPKTKTFISFHDWQPDLMFPSKANFISVKGDGIWRHNDRTDLFCNYYGVDYPFEIEYVTETGQTVNTLRSIEYLLECFVYDNDGIDKFHLLDFNFDELVVYNTEQVSGRLLLFDTPKNNPFALLNYPQINADSINILYDKVEQKYRINQFWDVTDDRGEFNINAQRPIWNTEWNGYIRTLNPNNLNYAKSTFERKKFRHYLCNVLFKRNVSGNVKMMLKLANNKNLYSPR